MCVSPSICIEQFILTFDLLICCLGLGQDADVLIHEATNTFLPGVDKDGNLKLVTRDAKIHGHSTPFMVRKYSIVCFVC